MLLHEHQGKSLLRSVGISTPQGALVSNASELEQALSILPESVVLKVQIASGRRGKSGGIIFAASPEEARLAFSQLCGTTINGHQAKTILVEECVPHVAERYMSVSLETGEFHLHYAGQGGIDIEEYTAQDASNLISIAVDPTLGVNPDALRSALEGHFPDPKLLERYENLGRQLISACRQNDALLIELNPVVELENGTLCALDARVIIDGRAISRQSETWNTQAFDALSVDVKEKSSLYSIKTNPRKGNVGLIGLGSGLNITLMDWLESFGVQVHSLVDIDDFIGTDRATEGIAELFQYFDNEADVQVILINVITCGYKLDDIVAALTRATVTRQSKHKKPVVLNLRGNAMELTPGLLDNAGLSNSTSLSGAIEATVKLARSGQRVSPC